MDDYEEQYIGTIKMFAGNFAPRHWELCDGRVMPISFNTALFSILGTAYGGNGQTTFALPDFRGRAALGTGQEPGNEMYELGESSGRESVQLMVSQMPAHNHLVRASSKPADRAIPTDGIWAKEPLAVTFLYSHLAADTKMNPAAIGTMGDNRPHQNMQPYLAVNFIICVNGLYPPKP